MIGFIQSAALLHDKLGPVGWCLDERGQTIGWCLFSDERDGQDTRDAAYARSRGDHQIAEHALRRRDQRRLLTGRIAGSPARLSERVPGEAGTSETRFLDPRPAGKQ